MVCVCERVHACLHVHLDAVGFPSGPRVVVRFIFLSIVSRWDFKELLFVDQHGCCRLLAGPPTGELHLSSTSSPVLSPFAENNNTKKTFLRTDLRGQICRISTSVQNRVERLRSDAVPRLLPFG